jgi:hypothetical protein
MFEEIHENINNFCIGSMVSEKPKFLSLNIYRHMECYGQSGLSFVSDELEEVVKNTKTDMAPGSSLSSSLKTTDIS